MCKELKIRLESREQEFKFRNPGTFHPGFFELEGDISIISPDIMAMVIRQAAYITIDADGVETVLYPQIESHEICETIKREVMNIDLIRCFNTILI